MSFEHGFKMDEAQFVAMLRQTLLNAKLIEAEMRKRQKILIRRLVDKGVSMTRIAHASGLSRVSIHSILKDKITAAPERYLRLLKFEEALVRDGYPDDCCLYCQSLVLRPCHYDCGTWWKKTDQRGGREWHQTLTCLERQMRMNKSHGALEPEPAEQGEPG